MADDKSELIEMFRELGELTILEEEDTQSFRVRAYESASRAIEMYAGDITKLSAAALQKLDGIGKSSAAKIREFIDSGKVEKLEVLREKHPASVVALLQLPGLGPKGVGRLRRELGILTISDLRTAVEEKKIRAMRGFGPKSEEKIANTLARLAKDGVEGRTPISVALPLAERVVEILAAVPGVNFAGYCGSLRRFSETIGDVDVVVASDDSGPVMDAVVKMRFVAEVLLRGETKTSVVTQRGTQIDVRVVPLRALGAAMSYFTGSKAHNVKLRQRALAQGMTLNEYSLSEIATGRIVAQESEEAIYAALGLPWISPVLREDMGEIELAEQGKLPQAIDSTTLVGDFHVHTSLSGDGRSTLNEMVDAARARGHRILAITEHAEGTVAGVSREALIAQRAEIAAKQAQLGDTMRLLHGVELNIGPEGELDYDAEFRSQFDWCLASIHDHFDLDRAAQTQRVIKAMRDPNVRMIGHLTARMLGARPAIDLDFDAVFDAAEETDTALEVNGGLPRLDLSVDILRRLRDRKVKLLLTSDAHHTRELDRLRYAAINVHKAWVDPSRVANTWDKNTMMAWVNRS